MCIRDRPSFDFIDTDAVRNSLSAEWNQCSSQLTSGEAGGYPLTSPRLGWAQPWGVEYGGMTGGDEIDMFSGLDIASTASNDGYRLAQLQQRCYIDRQPDALFDMEGNYTSVDDVMVTEGFGAPYVNLSFFGTISNGADPFGFDEAPQFQTEAVLSQNMAPDYYGPLTNFSPIDHQHFVRYTSNLKILTWLGGDTLSIELLQAAADNFHLGFHEHVNSAYGHIQGTGLRNLQNQVMEHPGQGLAFGRGQAWGMDAAMAAYATGDPAYRATNLPWIRLVADALNDGQSTCTGNIMAVHINKNFDGEYISRQVNESSFIENVLRSMETTVFQGVEPERALQLQQNLVASVRSTIEQPHFWNEQLGAPWFYAATGPADLNQGDFCGNAPLDLHSLYVNTTECYSSFAYAYQIDPDPIYLFRATQMLGGGNLWNQLSSNGTQNLQNTAALVALCQIIGEDEL